MAELASGAVSSLLGLLRNEALLLSRVGIDVEFIKEEMESMHSFLEHLARTEPPIGGHDEQVRTWMRQVRDLAHDCRNCIDLYLQRGDPALYQARGGRWRYLWWASWLLQKIIAQHRAAIRLRELKERARDVGERRFRYGVEIPGKAAAGASGSAAAPPTQSAAAMAVLLAAQDQDDDHDDSVHFQAAGMMSLTDASDPHRRRALEPHTLEDYCANKLADWLKILKAQTKKVGPLMPSIAIVTPDKEDAPNVAYDTNVMVGTHFKHSVFVDLHTIHLYFLLLQPFDILYYILWVLEHVDQSHSQHQGIDEAKEEDEWRHQQTSSDNGGGHSGDDDEDEDEEEEEEEVEEEEVEEDDDLEDEEETEENDDENNLVSPHSTSWQAYQGKWKAHKEIMGKMKEMKVDVKIKEIKDKIKELKAEHLSMEGAKFIGTTGILLMALLLLKSPSHEKKYLDIARNNARVILGWDKKRIVKKIATKLKTHMEEEEEDSNSAQICLNLHQYEGILWEMIHQTSKGKFQQVQEQDVPVTKLTSSNTIMFVESQNEQEDASVPVDKLFATGNNKQEEQFRSSVEETKKMINKIKSKIAEQLQIKGIADLIKGYLQGKNALIILNDSKKNYISRWEEIHNALSLLVDCVAGVVIMTSTKDRERTKKLCYPPGEPITYSLVGRYYDALLQFIGQRVNRDDGYNNRKIILDILGKCDPHEVCMKMFAHALYSNPNKNTEELRKLCEDLQDSKKSWATNAKKMFKFSYNDLPREHKSCLLYLAIFPQGYNIQRSTIVGRWVTEGLITRDDWHTAVRHADRCFDNLINRWLVLPNVTSAAGKVKSCVVGDEVHGYITKIAYKEHFLDARLSKQWARHFSIFSGLRLRASSNINKFVKKLHKYSPQLPLLKLLDLEECHWLNRDRRYLKDICSKILLLKYLSLRGTNITHLPSEINNLHELEVLDIRQTMVPEHETRDVLLLKLRRLLAGHADPSKSRSPDMGDVPIDSLFTSVRIPCKIEKMENMEVLSNVKASRHGDEIKEIRKLWKLRKLGVVIDDKEAHLRNFLRVASDLKERLQSVSITITETKSGGTQPIEELLSDKLYKRLTQPPKSLESLSISGTATQKRKIVPLLVKGTNELKKVTLSRTFMEQDDLNDIAELPNLRCVKLWHEAYNTQHKYTFKNSEFPHLKYFLVEGHNMTDITFEDGAAPELEKIILSSTKIRSLCGVGGLQKLTEFKLKDNELICSSSVDEVGETIDINIKTRSFTFNKNEFQHLKYFTVEGPNMSEIIFEEGTLPELEKITLSCTNISFLCGVDKLTKLKEIELKYNKKLLSLFQQANQITKVTLFETLLKQSDLHILATKPKIIYLELLEKSCDLSELIFDKEQFPKLKILVIKCSSITRVSFTEKSAPILKKLIWSYGKIESLSGIKNLLKLKELEFSGDLVPHKVRKDIETHHNKPFLIHKKPEQMNQTEESDLEDEDDTRCSPISWILKKKQVQP